MRRPRQPVPAVRPGPPGCYAELLQGAPEAVRERADPAAEFPYTERHLRCVWADPAYRPAALRTTDGQMVTVEKPGCWNLEPGPDFLDARLLLEPGRRRVSGDVEIHIRPADWLRHGHRDDRRYARVVAHVTYFPGALAAGALPAGAVQIPLREALRADPAFSFESLDLTAYPHAVIAPAPPCAAVLAACPAETRAAVLEAAGAERLRQKAARFSAAIREQGAEQALYAETLAALGYKQNRLPFRRLAAVLPFSVLREESAGDILRAYALLCGVSGLLPARAQAAWPTETKQFVRQLWDHWWKCQDRWSATGGLALPATAWTLAGLRPANSPLRRLMAAAELFGGPQPLAEWLTTAPDPLSAAWVRLALRRLQQAGRGSFWWRRYTWSGPPLTKPVALIGAGRAAALLTNVLVPWLMATGRIAGGATLAAHLPPEDDNSLVRRTAFALFGRDHNPTLYRSGLRQQGLLQIFHDFCLNACSGCGNCSLADALRQWQPGAFSGI